MNFYLFQYNIHIFALHECFAWECFRCFFNPNKLTKNCCKQWYVVTLWHTIYLIVTMFYVHTFTNSIFIIRSLLLTSIIVWNYQWQIALKKFACIVEATEWMETSEKIKLIKFKSRLYWQKSTCYIWKTLHSSFQAKKIYYIGYMRLLSREQVVPKHFVEKILRFSCKNFQLYVGYNNLWESVWINQFIKILIYHRQIWTYFTLFPADQCFYCNECEHYYVTMWFFSEIFLSFKR